MGYTQRPMKLSGLTRSPSYVFALCCALILLQANALRLQFREGFWPLKREPTRVAFSWDMFATRIERCGLAFNPPLETARLGREDHSRFMPQSPTQPRE